MTPFGADKETGLGSYLFGKAPAVTPGGAALMLTNSGGAAGAAAAAIYGLSIEALLDTVGGESKAPDDNSSDSKAEPERANYVEMPNTGFSGDK